MVGLGWLNWPNCNGLGFDGVKPTATVWFKVELEPEQIREFVSIAKTSSPILSGPMEARTYNSSMAPRNWRH